MIVRPLEATRLNYIVDKTDNAAFTDADWVDTTGLKRVWFAFKIGTALSGKIAFIWKLDPDTTSLFIERIALPSTQPLHTALTSVVVTAATNTLDMTTCTGYFAIELVDPPKYIRADLVSRSAGGAAAGAGNGLYCQVWGSGI